MMHIAIRHALPDRLVSVRAWELPYYTTGSIRNPDWIVGIKLGRSEDGRFTISDVTRLRSGPYEAADCIKATAGRDGVDVLIGLPRDPGQAGAQQLAWFSAQLAGFRVIASRETEPRMRRAVPLLAQIEAGNVAMMHDDWNRALLDELAEFPHGRHQEQADALVRAFEILTARPPPEPRRFPMMAR